MRYLFLLITAINFIGLPMAQAATNCATQTDIPETECQALVSLFNSTTGAGWYDLFSGGWAITNSPCSWAGVTCQDGHVVTVDKQNNGLEGPLPDLTALTQLETLNLNGNQLNGPISPANLPTRLQALYLSNNQLSGEAPDLRAFTQLVTVQLNDNPLTGTPQFPPQLAGTLQFSETPYRANESDGTLTLIVTRSGGSDGELVAHYATLNETAEVGSDFETAEGSLTWLDQQSDDQTFIITLTDDTVVENDETFTVRLTDTDGAQLATATVTIADNDMNQLTLNAATTQFSEAIGVVAATVTRTGETTAALTVNLSSSDTSAVTVPTTVTINSGAHSITFDMTAVDDTFLEGTQTVILTASAPSYLDSTLTINVTDDEVDDDVTPPPPTQHTLAVNVTGNGAVTSNDIDCSNGCTYTYNEGSQRILTATPATGYRFTGWSGICSGTGTCQVTMNQAQNVTATFNRLPPDEFPLTVNKVGTGAGNVTGSGIDCGSDCTEQYVKDTPVTITATTSTDSTFAGWTGACTGTTPSCQVTMSQAQNVTANFALIPPKRLTVQTQGQGTVTSLPTGIDCGIDCEESYRPDTPVILTAQPDTHYLFTGWTGACQSTMPDCQVTMSQAQTVTATFTINVYRLNVSKNGLGMGSVTGDGIDCGPDCSADYNANTVVTLTAQPAADSLFIGWRGDCAGTACQITMTEAQNVTATFKLNRYSLTLSQTGTGSGRVMGQGIDCITNCTNAYDANTSFTLTATPATDSLFTGWTGACSGTTPACPITMTQAQAVTATFELIPPKLLSVQTQGQGAVTSFPTGIDCGIDCEQAYRPDTPVILTAQPDTHYLFTGWSGACQGTMPDCQVTLSQAQTVTATFTIKTYRLNVSKNGLGTGSVTGDGIDCGTDCSADYNANTVVTVTAQPAADSLFVGWHGDCAGTANCQITMTEAQNVTATFNRLPPDEFALTVNKAGTGAGSVTGNGIDCGSDCTEQFVEDTPVILTATASAGSTFAGWRDACTGTEDCQVTMNQAQNVTAAFELIPLPEYVLTISTEGLGSGQITAQGIDCQADCTEHYVENTLVTLTAMPNAGSVFSGWQGASCTGTGTCRLTLNANQNVTATFGLVAPEKFALTVNQAGTGNGNVISNGIDCGNDCTEQYIKDTPVSLTATPLADSIFFGWRGACTGTGTCQVTMNTAQNVTATFNLLEYELTVSNEGTGSGQIIGQGIDCGTDCRKHYVKDTLVNLTAAPSAGSTFVGWRDACTGTTDCTVTMSAAQNVVATFNLIPAPEHILTVSKIGTGSGHVTGNGMDCSNACTQQYVENTIVTLTAAPSADSTFAGWRGDCAGTATCQVTMIVAQNVTAIFNPLPPDEFALTVNSVGNGRVTGNGIDCGSDCTELYLENTAVTLTATPADGFVGWQGACTGTSACQITMNQNQHVTATFESNDKVALQLIATPQPVSVGTAVVISAQIQAGNQKVSSAVLEWGFDADFWQFNQLMPGNSFEQVLPTSSSDCESHQGCIELRVETASPISGTFEVVTLNLTAKKSGSTEVYFTEKTAVLSAAGQSVLNKPMEPATIVIIDTPTLTVTKDGTGEGTVTGSGIDCGPDCSERYEANRVVPLIATPAADSTFAGWQDACTGTTVCQVTMNTSQHLTATFNRVDIKQYALTVNHQGAGSGQVTGPGIDCGQNCAAEYDANTQVTLTANAEVGSYFTGWQGACSGNSHCILTLTQAQDAIAIFEQLPTLTVNKIGTGDGSIIGCGSHCTQVYEINTVVTLSATPNADSLFAGWSGDCAGTDTCQVTMTTDKTVTALFIKNSELGREPEEALPCPTSGLITVTCNAQGQTLTDVIVVRASVANAVFAGTSYNYGWIANSTIQPGAELIGGIITGYITNQGTMKDFDFRGARIKGGTLSGDIINNSQIGGTFQDIQLTANTRISGGQLQGVIAGDEQAPAWLEHLAVTDNSQLSGVIISDTVQLGEPVFVGKGVRFTHQKRIPTDLELMALLPDLPASVDCVQQTAVQRADLSKDVLEPGEGILTAINALPDFNSQGWVITQAADVGYLQLTIDVLRFAVQPISVTSTHSPAAMELLEQQNVRFITDTGIQVLAQPAVQAPCILQNGLADLGLPEVILQTNGNLYIPATGEYWYSARPDWVSIEVGGEDEDASGLFLMDYPHLTGVAVAYTIFVDNTGAQRQQFFYPAFAQPEVLYSTAQDVVVEPEGLVTFKLGKQNYHGVLDYLVTKGTPIAENQLQVTPVPDVNGDGKEDWVLVYPNGERQILFQSEAE